MDSIKIDGKEVAVDSLPSELQATIQTISKIIGKIKDHSEALEDLHILYDVYTKRLQEQYTRIESGITI